MSDDEQDVEIRPEAENKFETGLNKVNEVNEDGDAEVSMNSSSLASAMKSLEASGQAEADAARLKFVRFRL